MSNKYDNNSKYQQLPQMEMMEERLLLAGDFALTVDALTTNDTTPALSGTIVELTATITIAVDGQVIGTGNNWGDGTWGLANDELAALGEGTWDIVVFAVSGGLTATDSTSDELVIDTTLPVVTIDTLTTNDTTPELTGTVDDTTATISVNVDGGDYAATNNGDGTWTLADDTIAGLAEATWEVVVTATDDAGNDGVDATNTELIVDTTAPVVDVNPFTTNDTTPELSGAVDDNAATINVNIDGNDYAATNNADGTWTLADDTIAALTEGTWEIAVTATDAAGNDGVDATNNELVVDLTAPTVRVNALTTNDTTPELTGTVNDAAATVALTIDGNPYVPTNNGDGTWTLDDNAVAALAEGTYEVVVTATDAVGNIGSDPTNDEVVVDLTAPVVTVDALTTNDTTPELTGTIDDTTATIALTVDGNPYVPTNNGDGTWTLADDTVAALAEGTFEVAVTATDTAGNAGVDATNNELEVDLTAPVVTINTLRTYDSTPELTGTVDDAAATISVTVDGNVYAATNNGDGTWTLADDAVATLFSTVYNVAVTATDAAGNVGSDATTDELDVRTGLELGGAGSIRSITYMDIDGSRVRAILNGSSAGNAMLGFSSTSAITVGGSARRVVLTSVDGITLENIAMLADTRGIKIVSAGGTIVGSTLGELTGNFTLGNLMAKRTDLNNNGIDMAGGVINRTALRSIDNADINMGAVSATDLRFQILMAIDGSNITIENGNNVRSFFAGSMNDSSLLLDVTYVDANVDGVYDLPALVDLNTGTIGQFKIKGYRGAAGDLFTNSNVGADTITKAFIRDATLDNGGEAFGLSSNTLGQLKLRQGATNYKFGVNWLGVPDDLTVL